MSEQLFKPLVFQLIHWFTNNRKYESPETMALLDAILVWLDNFVTTNILVTTWYLHTIQLALSCLMVVSLFYCRGMFKLFRKASKLPSILGFLIAHNSLCLPPKCCVNYYCDLLFGICRPPKSINFYKICGANRVGYGQLEKKESELEVSKENLQITALYSYLILCRDFWKWC